MTDTLREAFEAWLRSDASPINTEVPLDAEIVLASLAAWQAGAQAEREKKITVPDQMQDWKGMDGTTAWHLIDRHADGWADVGKMMGEWLDANRDRSTP